MCGSLNATASGRIGSRRPGHHLQRQGAGLDSADAALADLTP